MSKIYSLRLNQGISYVLLLIHVQVITKKSRHQKVKNKLLNDLLTTIYL